MFFTPNTNTQDLPSKQELTNRFMPYLFPANYKHRVGEVFVEQHEQKLSFFVITEPICVFRKKLRLLAETK